MAYYENLTKETEERIRLDLQTGNTPRLAFNERNVIRRNPATNDTATVWRGAFVRDIDKIVNCPYYNRYTDKTQVFSLYKNDDITRRALHVQLVSRIARTIGKTLGLNMDLIEAIALGHDIGHTPFGHAGERFLDKQLAEHTGRRFAHNIHSVRVLDTLFPLNVSLQTLNGIAAHNGELELREYRPVELTSFAEFDVQIERCYQDAEYVKKLVPSTLEGCVMRISDIIAYLGKDRHDAENNKLLSADDFEDSGIGKINAEIVNNLMVNILEHSYGQPFIKMDEKHFTALKKAKADNYQTIYGNEQVKSYESVLEIMTAELYEKLLVDLKNGNTSSPVFTHHIAYLNKPYYKQRRLIPYEETEYNQIVVDYIASMTDDYFVDLHKYLFPDSKHRIVYKGYFD
ncbi:MAG: HD domain-containing protein [Clostridia bacterium]|nr:HD domain-containing protein [Clostridia bacterium]